MKTLPFRASLILRAALALATVVPVTATAQNLKAIAEAQRATSGPSADTARHLRMAELLLEAKDNKFAAMEAREVLKADPRNLDAHRILVAALARMGSHAEALKVVEEMAKLAPDDAWVAETRGELLLATGEKDKALAQFEALAPRSAKARFLAARLLDAKRLAGDTAARDKQRALLDGFLKDRASIGTPEAKEAERMLLEIDYGDVGKTFWQAREAYFNGFKTGGAVSAAYIRQAEEGMKKVLQVNPNLQAAHAILGMCYATVKSKNYDLALAEQHLRKAPDVADAWFFLGRLYREQEKLPEAAGAFEKCLKLQPNHAEAGYQLGVVYKGLKRVPDALKMFEAVVRAAPDHPAATKALSELQALAPNSEVVARYSHRLNSPPDADLFSTERYRAGIEAVEKHLLGGVEEGPEVVWLERMVRRLVAANELPQRVPFRVKLGKTMMVNCFATPHGNIYVTRGFLAHIQKRWPDVKMDENNSYVAGVMAHEIAHVIKGHILSRDLFRKALQQAGEDMDPTLFRLTTRLNEIEADREGFLYALAAGYNPNAMVEWMEVAAADLGDPPPMEDHPTFDERVTFLLDFWTNDVRFAYQAFETGTAALVDAQKQEHKDLVAAKRQYEIAAQELDRYVRFFRGSKEAWNNLAIAQAKLGVIEQGDGSPLAKWYTPMSIEKSQALKLPAVKRHKRRGTSDIVFLERAKSSLQKALELDGKYKHALVNLAAVQIGLKQTADAKVTLDKAKALGADGTMVAMLHGILAAEEGRHDDAVKQFEVAAKDGKDTRALYCLALAKATKGDKAGAKAAYAAFLDKEDGNSPWAVLAKAAVGGLL